MAENISQETRTVVNQFQVFFQSLSMLRKVVLASVLGVVLLGLATMIYFANRQTWAPLYSNISHEDTALIQEKLEQSQIPVLVGPGGSSVLVPAGQADEARIVLARERVTLGGGLGFADLFVGSSDLGETEFQQQVKFRIALEGELARMINKLQTVSNTKVTLALPKRSLFLSQDRPPTASVVVSAKGGSLHQDQVQTISHLVANSVEGLAVANVIVADISGRTLSRDISGGGLNRNYFDNFAFRQRFEQTLEMRIVSQLAPIVGEGRVLARVAAELNFDKQSTKEEIYDPDGSVVRSEQNETENATGTRTIPVGVPGVLSNLPETQAGASEVANVSQVNKNNQTRNYENSVRTVVNEPSVGRIHRLSVSVLIDGKYKPVTDPESGGVITRRYEEWSNSEKEKIQRLIRAAVGFEKKRGDALEVVNLRFTKALEEDVARQLELTKRNRQFFLDILRYTFLGVGLLAFILFVVRPMMQHFTIQPEGIESLMGLPSRVAEMDDAEEVEIPSEQEAGSKSREQMLDMARTDPLATAALVRLWLRERR